MASQISVRFYEVERLQPSGPSLQHALNDISQRPLADRQIQISGGYVVRLERFHVDAGELAGELTRVRDTDYPFEVLPNGVGQLPTEGPIGNSVAFRFRPADHTLAIQYDTRIVSPGRAMDYLMQCDARFAYAIKVKMDEESWRKFNEGEIRKLRIGIASPQHLGNIENEGAAVRESLRQLGDAYGAPVVTIEVGMGHRKGALDETAKAAARAIWELFQGGEADLRSLKASVKSDEGEPAEDVNLIDEILSRKLDFPSPQNDPDENYRIRSEIVRNALQDHG